MPVSCADVQKFVHPYLDGEFEEGERFELEHHLATCATCRQTVAFEQTFKAAVKTRLRRPVAPAALRARVVQALDRADAEGSGPVPRLWRRVVPATLVAAAAAAAAFFLWPGVSSYRTAGVALVEDVVKTHQKDLPVEVAGNEEQVREFLRGRVDVPVRPPRMPNAVLVGARIGRLGASDVPLYRYRFRNASVTVFAFDPAVLQRLEGWRHRKIRDHEVYTGAARGFSTAFYEQAGLGYGLISELDQDQMLDLVSASFPNDGP